MSFEDFMKIWGEVDICHLTNDAFSGELMETDDDSGLGWECATHHGEWVVGKSAGGCGNGDVGNLRTLKFAECLK